MHQNIKRYLGVALTTLALFPVSIWAQPTVKVTSGTRSVVLQGNHGSASVHYGNTTNVYSAERLGKKIVIRKMYIVPFDQFTTHGCSPGIEFKRCGDFYEAVQLYLEVQSIWPEPVLITAGHLEIISPKHNFGLGPPPSSGVHSLDEMITANNNPEEFLIQPGKIKIFNFSRGFRLNGVLEFFDKNLSDAEIQTHIVPYVFYDLRIVDDFNRFLKKKYGTKAALKISLFEKDYQPLLITVAKLGDGTDFFSRGDPTKRNGYNFQHDRFVAEVLYQLRGGMEPLHLRMLQKIK